ncbi:MAG: transposase, partial [Solirubrobacteraceae bacterium]
MPDPAARGGADDRRGDNRRREDDPHQRARPQHRRVVSKALVVAYAVHESGIREVIGLDVGEVESGSFWVEFLRGLKRRGLAGVRLAMTDQHEGRKHAVARVLGCPWQRCSVRFTRDMGTGVLQRPVEPGVQVSARRPRLK